MLNEYFTVSSVTLDFFRSVVTSVSSFFVVDVLIGGLDCFCPSCLENLTFTITVQVAIILTSKVAVMGNLVRVTNDTYEGKIGYPRALIF